MRSSLLFAIFVILTILSSSSLTFSSEIDSNHNDSEYDDSLAFEKKLLDILEKFEENRSKIAEKMTQSVLV